LVRNSWADFSINSARKPPLPLSGAPAFLRARDSEDGGIGHGGVGSWWDNSDILMQGWHEIHKTRYRVLRRNNNRPWRTLRHIVPGESLARLGGKTEEATMNAGAA
jgi:hypothetical protein